MESDSADLAAARYKIKNQQTNYWVFSDGTEHVGDDVKGTLSSLPVDHIVRAVAIIVVPHHRADISCSLDCQSKSCGRCRTRFDTRHYPRQSRIVRFGRLSRSTFISIPSICSHLCFRRQLGHTSNGAKPHTLGKSPITPRLVIISKLMLRCILKVPSNFVHCRIYVPGKDLYWFDNVKTGDYVCPLSC